MTIESKDTADQDDEDASAGNAPDANGPAEKRVERSMVGLTIFILQQILIQKRWVLLPLWIVLAVILLMFLLSGSPLIPAIYIAF